MTKNDYTFLIVTPSYNQGAYLKQTVDSVLSQHGFSTHYWVMDGGSTDQSVQILTSYTKRIQWESKKDRGQTHAINKGIQKFRELNIHNPEKVIFAYINSDDYYLPNAFAKVVAAFESNHTAGWVTGDCVIDSTHNQAGHQMIAKYWKGLLKRIYSATLLHVLNPIAQPATFIRWSALKDVGNFDESLSYVMDYDYWLRLQRHVGNPIFIHEPLAVFRIHEASKGGSLYAKQFAEQYQIATKYTDNWLVLVGHRIHNWITNFTYNLLK